MKQRVNWNLHKYYWNKEHYRKPTHCFRNLEPLRKAPRKVVQESWEGVNVTAIIVVPLETYCHLMQNHCSTGNSFDVWRCITKLKHTQTNNKLIQQKPNECQKNSASLRFAAASKSHSCHDMHCPGFATTNLSMLTQRFSWNWNYANKA